MLKNQFFLLKNVEKNKIIDIFYKKDNKIMFSNIWLFIEVFLFIFCCLNIVKNLYIFVKVLRTKDGHIENNVLSTILFGVSISFVMAMLIVGF